MKKLKTISVGFNGSIHADAVAEDYLEYLRANDFLEEEINQADQELMEMAYTYIGDFDQYCEDIARSDLEDALDAIEEYLKSLDWFEWVLYDNSYTSFYGFGPGQVIPGYLGECTEFKDFKVNGALENGNFTFKVDNNELEISYHHHDGVSSYKFLNLGYLTKKRLIEFAKDNSIQVASRWTKDEIIDALQEGLLRY